MVLMGVLGVVSILRYPLVLLATLHGLKEQWYTIKEQRGSQDSSLFGEHLAAV